jgi:hypothetical protein
MADNKPKSPQELNQMLKDMEEMSRVPASKPAPDAAGGGAFKSLLGFFIKVHDENEENQPATAAGSKPKTAEPAKPVTPPAGKPQANAPAPAPRRVSELVADEPMPKFDKEKIDKANDRASKPFTDIYQEAGIKAAASSVDDLADLLQNPTVASQPLAIKVVAVSLALTAKGTKIDDYIADAVRKDRALDAYQKMLNDHAAAIEARAKSEIERIQKEVEEYLKQKQAEMERLRAEASDVSRQAIEFSLRRQSEEERLANIISPFLEGKPNPVTIGNDPGKSEEL